MKLKFFEGSYYITRTKSFQAKIVPTEILLKCFEFAYEMAFGEGHHRSHRSGGHEIRLKIEIFRNSLQGKIAEAVIYEYLYLKGIKCIEVDYNIYGKGVWDNSDLIYKDFKISIKSAAYFSNLLLLETKDWDSEGNYLPNSNDHALTSSYDYFILSRVKPNSNSIFKSYDGKEELLKLLQAQSWHYDIAGCCSNDTIKYIIKNEYILPQGSMLNGRTKMDAENFYIQSGDLKPVDFLINLLSKK